MSVGTDWGPFDDSAARCWCRIEALAAHAFRVVVYKYVVLPMGLRMDNYACEISCSVRSALPSHRYRNSAFGRLLTHDVDVLCSCGTAKAISGHTHMNSFHVLYCIRCLMADRNTQGVAASATAAAMQSETEKIHLRMGRAALCLALTLWIFFTGQTYLAGYHTLRHMIYGAGAGAMTLLVFDGLSGWASLWLSGKASDHHGETGGDLGAISQQLLGGVAHG